MILPVKDNDRPLSGDVIHQGRWGGSLPLTILLSLHVPLAIAMSRMPALATLHALTTLFVGLWWAATCSIDRVAYLGAYIAGAEVLWRMTNARVFWEFGKYSVVLIFLLAMVRMRVRILPMLPLLYFALHLPSIVAIVGDLGFRELRDDLSFNLSGPLSLAVSACFYAQLCIDKCDIVKVLRLLVIPIAGVSTLVLFGIATAESIVFINDSNASLSGGFGPNQVSSVLGLGSLAALLCVLIGGRGSGGIMLGLALLLATQSALTFSRSGLYCAGGATLIAIASTARSPTLLLKFLAVSAVILVTAYFLILPALDVFTDGALTKRFADTSTTGRSDFVENDLDLWMEYPLLGVGPGASPTVHNGKATHSEISRLLVEHGLFGFFGLLLLGFIVLRNYSRAPTVTGRVVCGGLLGFGLMFIGSNGMRLVFPSFLFGLSFVTCLPDDKP